MHGLICFTSILISLVFCDAIPRHMFHRLFTSPWLFLAGAFGTLLPRPISSQCSFWFPLGAGGICFRGGSGGGGLMCGGVQIIVLMVQGSSIQCVRKVFRGARPSAYRGVGNVGFSECFACMLDGWLLIAAYFLIS